MTRLSGGMKAGLRAFADDPDECISGAQMTLNGVSNSSLSSLKAANLIEGLKREGWRADHRRRWWRLTARGREVLEQIGA